MSSFQEHVSKSRPAPSSLLLRQQSVLRGKEVRELCKHFGFQFIEARSLPNDFHYVLARDKRTNAELIRLITPSDSTAHPLVFYSFRTPAFVDSGVFHVREHLAFEKDPMLFHWLSRTAGFPNINAETHNAFTHYYMQAVGYERFSIARRYMLDTISTKNFTWKELSEQVGRLFREVDDEGQITAIVRGRLLAEMMGRGQEGEYARELGVWAALFPNSFLGKVGGGLPKNIREMTLSDIRRVDREFYNPENLILGESGPHDLSDSLRVYRKYLNTFPVTQRTRPKILLPDFTEDAQGSVRLPVPGMQSGICFAWRAKEEDPVDAEIFHCLGHFLADKPGSPLRRLMLSLRDHGSPSIRSVNASQAGPIHVFSFEITFEKELTSEEMQKSAVHVLDGIYEMFRTFQQRGLPKVACERYVNEKEHDALLQAESRNEGHDLLARIVERRHFRIPLGQHLLKHERISEWQSRIERDPSYLARCMQKHFTLPSDLQVGEAPAVNNLCVAIFRPDENMAFLELFDEVLWLRSQVRTPEAVQKLPEVSLRSASWARGLPVPEEVLVGEQSNTQAVENKTGSYRHGNVSILHRRTELAVPEFRIVFSTDHLNDQEKGDLYAIANLLAELGSESRPNDSFGDVIARKTAGIEVFADAYPVGLGDWKSHGRTCLSFIGLAKEGNFRILSDLLLEGLKNPNFSNHLLIESRLKARLQAHGIILHEQAGPIVYGYLRSLAGFSPLGAVADQVDGFGQIDTLQKLLHQMRFMPKQTIEYLKYLWESSITSDRMMVRVNGSDRAALHFSQSLERAGFVGAYDRIQDTPSSFERYYPSTIRHGFVVNNPASAYSASYLIPHLSPQLIPMLPVASRILGIRRECGLVLNKEHASAYGAIYHSLVGAPVMSFSYFNESDPVVARNQVLSAARILSQGRFSRNEIRWAVASVLDDMHNFNSAYEQGAAELVWLLSGRSLEHRRAFSDAIKSTNAAQLHLIGEALADARAKLSEVIIGPRIHLENYEISSGHRLKWHEPKIA